MSEQLANAHEHGNCNLCDDLERQLAEAQGKLEKYGNHIGPCKWRRDSTCSLSEKPCTCEFSDAILSKEGNK